MYNSPQNSRRVAGAFVGWRRLAFCLFVLTAATAAFAGAKFSSVVVFGDSLSDTGRLFRLTHGGFPPRVAYYDGRQTNGPVWVEYLADELGLEHRLKNYAVVGAMTGPSAAIPSGNVKSDVYPAGLEGTSLSGQFAQYLASTGGHIDPAALYIVEGGANDLIRPLAWLLTHLPPSEAEFMQAVNEIATPTVVNVATIVGTLKAMGAQHIAVVNVPDFGLAPFLVNSPASATVSMIVDLVNDSVAVQLDGIEAMGGNKIARINAFDFIDDVVLDPVRYGLVNVTDQFMTLAPDGTVTFASPRRHVAARWFFWDDLHPTTRGHELFARNALRTLRETFPAVRPVHGDCR